uniref:Uncharacterized protein n=1 Tax=Ciona savignyi TaxID=51511 RepID=H2ZMK1_CIOSA
QADTVPKPAAPDAANLTNILTHLLANPDTSQIQNLAGLLSNSQQNQLNDLLYQIKGNENVPSKEENKEEVEVIEETVFQQPSHNSQPPFLHHAHPSGQPPFLHSEPKKPAFNREVLDFDYSDDEKTPPATVSQNQRILPPATHNQRREFDPASIANLPTHDQLQQLSMNGALHNPLRPPPAPPSNHQPPYQTSHQPHEVERMRRLEAEQEQFNMQIEQMASEKRDPFRGPDAKRRRSRSRSRSRSRDRHRNRSHHSREKSHRSRRSRSRSRDRSRRSRRSRSHEKKK